MRDPKYRAVFKRLETDAEFRARLRTHGFYTLEDGEGLDDTAWRNKKMQRRIVEDVA